MLHLHTERSQVIKQSGKFSTVFISKPNMQKSPPKLQSLIKSFQAHYITQGIENLNSLYTQRIVKILLAKAVAHIKNRMQIID